MSKSKDVKQKSKEIPKEVVDDIDLPLPPDGGWGWAVAAACFLTNLIVDGICYTFGVIYNDLMEHFQAGSAEIALIGALLPAVYLLVGPIVGALCNKYGCRIVAIIGSITASAAFVVSSFSTSIVMMQLVYGVIGGAGFGFMYLPSIVMVGHYFDKKRALATGISVCGSGTGTFVLAPVATYLVNEYGWKGCNIILGAFILNGIAFAAIYRPLHHEKPKKPGAMEAVAAKKLRSRSLSIGSQDGAVITHDNQVKAVNNNKTEDSQDPTHKKVKDVIDYTGSKASVGSRRRMSNASVDLRKELAKPFARQDVLYTGSVQNLPEFKASQDMGEFVESILNLPPEEEDASQIKKALRIVIEMFDFSLLKSPSFILLCASGTLFYLGLYTPFVYVSQKAMNELGVEASMANMILFVLGVVNTVSRVLVGFIADRPWVDKVLVHNLASVVAGVSTASVAVLNSYALLCVYAAVFGVAMAAFLALRSVVFVEVLGLKKLNNAYGLTCLFQGIAVLIGSPLSGGLYESTGSYVASFVVCGAIMALGGIVCLPVRRVAAWEQARENRAREARGGKPIYKPIPQKNGQNEAV